jgi:hypothetical protein
MPKVEKVGIFFTASGQGGFGALFFAGYAYQP